MRNAGFVRVMTTAFVLAIAASFAAAQTPPKAQPPQHEQMQPKTVKPGAPAKMTMSCEQMMQAHQKMMDDMKAMDARLDTLVQQMNTATGPAKVDATSVVVSELVTQRKTMHEGMDRMPAMMMQHMAEHMQAGADAMMKCPMMQKMMK